MPEAKNKQGTEGNDSPTSSFKALIVAVLTAIVTGAVGYGYSVVSDARKTRIDFVNEQIQKLYGPLYAASQADDAVWDLFVRERWQNPLSSNESNKFFDNNNPPSVEQVRRWRRWIRSVFQPLNLQMETIISGNTQLLVGEGMPIAFSALAAHAESYKAIINAWGADEDLKECDARSVSNGTNSLCPAVSTFTNTSGINYPDAIVLCISEDYFSVRQLRDELEESPWKIFREKKLKRSASCEKQFKKDVATGVSDFLHP